MKVAVKSFLKIAYTLTPSFHITKSSMASVAVWLVFHPTNVHPAFVAVYSERFTVSHDLKLTTGLLVVPPFVVALNVTTEDHSHL